MSTFKNPVGPQPRSVYWRRRLILIGGLVAVIVVVVLIVARPGPSDGTPTPAHRGTSASQPPEAASTSAPTASAATRAAVCDASVVRVEAVTDKDIYAAGELPQLSVAITNAGGSACLLDAGTARQLFTITSGSETYWKSTDCQTDAIDAEVIVQPGKTISSQTPIVWDRTRSDPATCQAHREEVPAGGASYHLSTSIGGFDGPETKQFILK